MKIFLRQRFCLLVLFLFGVQGLIAQKPVIRKHTIQNPATKTAFLLIHITDTHVGQGMPDRDYGSPGFLDSLSEKRGGYATDRLRAVIRYINKHVSGREPGMAFLSGDITDSGELSELLHARQILEDLKIPYVPLIGNHDAWPYTRYGDEASDACGDSLINSVFEEQFQKLKTLFTFYEDQRPSPCYDSLSKRSCYLQNFTFSAYGWRFIFLDFNPRYHVRVAEPGIGPEVCLHPQPCGTLPFLRRQLAAARSAGEPVCLVSHHPPMTFKFLGKHYAFTRWQKKELLGILKEYRGVARLWLCGHFHRNARYTLRGAGPLRVFETKANLRAIDGAFRLFHIGM
jgi:3',5'-cyclic AMP phosphodiesterase CpdA